MTKSEKRQALYKCIHEEVVDVRMELCHMGFADSKMDSKIAELCFRIWDKQKVILDHKPTKSKNSKRRTKK